MEEHVKNILAIAWAAFNTPLWYARQEMQEYLEKHFELKKTTTYDTAEGLNGRMPTFF
jgi:hypothetical protein